MSITICIVAYNEEKNINKTIENFIKVLKQKKIINYEIIIYNDGSTDNTVTNVKKFLSKKIFLVSNICKSGWAKMYEKTLKKSSKEYITFFPADNAFSSKKLGEFFTNYNNYDCVFGKRINYYDDLVFTRRVLSKFLNFIMNLLFYKKIDDFHSSHIYKKKLLRKKILFVKENACWLEVNLNISKKAKKYVTKELYLNKGHEKRTKQMSFKNLYNFFYSLLNIILLRIFHIKNF